MLNLQVHARNAPVRALQVEQGCTIGKDASCDVIVKGMLIGKLQARIVREHNAYYIEDQGGIAATLVNGSPITRYGPLTEADQIEIGVTTIRIVRAAVATPPAHQVVEQGQQAQQPVAAGHADQSAPPAPLPLQAHALAHREPSFAVTAPVSSSSQPS
jgi:pilus assembly protein CpaF